MLQSFFFLALLGQDLQQFSEWAVNHNKTYLTETSVTQGFMNWKDNSIYVAEHNENNNDFKLEMNEFGDMRLDWTTRPAHNKYMKQRVFENPTEKKAPPGLPRSIDWRTKGRVTAVKNQQQCGSCWAFSAVGAMEGQHAHSTGDLISLSESQIVDCDKHTGDHGCLGGLMDGAFKYGIKYGIESEKEYPYDPNDDPCSFQKNQTVATFSDYKDIIGGEGGLKEAVATIGPISVGIDASHTSFQLYKTGVYSEPACSTTMLDHGVLVVGYDTTDSGQDYWIVKNSWGDTWGQKGYIYMARNHNNSCGIATEPSYPIV